MNPDYCQHKWKELERIKGEYRYETAHSTQVVTILQQCTECGYIDSSQSYREAV